MEVRVISERSPAERPEADYVRVETWCDPEQDTVTLATIQRVVHKVRARSDGATQSVRTLVQQLPMTPDEALGFATRYAKRKKISLVLASSPKRVESAG